MADQIKIAELNIDTKALITNLSDTKKEIDKLKQSQAELKSVGDTSSKAFIQNEIALKSLNKSYRDGAKLADAVTQAEKNLEATLSSEGKTTQELYDSRRQLNEIAKNIKGDSEKEVALREKVNAAIDEQTQAIRGQQSEFNSSKDKIGEYSQAFEGAIGSNTALGGAINSVRSTLSNVTPVYNVYKSAVKDSVGEIRAAASATQGLTLAQRASAVATALGSNALKLFRVALISTGIGAVVVALGSLVAFLTSTQSGINKINSVLIPMKTVFESLFGLFQKTGEALFNAFSNPKQTIKELSSFITNTLIKNFEGLGNIIKGIFTFDYTSIKEGAKQIGDANKVIIDGVKEASKLVGDTVKDAIERGKQLAALQQQFSAGEADYIKQVGQLKEDFKQLNQTAEDTTKTLAEREAAAKKSIDTAKEINRLNLERLNQEIQILQLKQANNDTSDEERAELAKLVAARNEANAQALEQITTQTNKVNTIRKEAASKAKSLRDERLKQEIDNLNIELELFKQNNREKLNSNLTTAKEAADKELAIVNQKLKNKLISEKEAELARLQINDEFADLQAEKEQAELDRLNDFENRKQELQNEIDLDKQATAQDKEELRLEQEFEKQVAELERLQLNEDQKTELLALIEEQRGQLLNDIKLKAAQKGLEDYKKVSDAEIQARERNAAAQASVARQLTGILTGLLGDSLGAKLASIAIEAGIQAGLVSINTASSQAINLAQATAVAPPPFNLPFIGTALGQNAVMQGQSSAAIARILGGAAIQGIGTIASSKKFASGGILNGASHAAGGIKTPYGELEGGEAVINKRSTSMFGGLLSQINVAGGGKAFANGGMMGTNESIKGSVIDYDLLAAKVAQANQSLPSPVVSVQEINSVSNQVNVIESGANF
ncbi:hypothetical protein [Leeuwenhoekiella sp. NPDC079379]|uniref:hypothetical protein n=1 Tax=Leeuwenhoekiella sp. NPDC079379 TaxID=3364122 RepID=UPI0037C83872